MSTAAATRIKNPEATVSQSQPSVPKATANTDSITQSNTVSASSTFPQPPENPSSAVGGETKVPNDCTSSESAAALLTEVQKKIRRSQRFGVPVQLSEGDKRNSRAERFGSEVGAKGSNALKKSEEQKKAARAERFGLVQSTHDDNDAKKKARHARVAPSSAVDPVEEDKRKARAARFSQDKPTAASSTNGKEQSDVGQ